jgi:hypothetical protein
MLADAPRTPPPPRPPRGGAPPSSRRCASRRCPARSSGATSARSGSRSRARGRRCTSSSRCSATRGASTSVRRSAIGRTTGARVSPARSARSATSRARSSSTAPGDCRRAGPRARPARVHPAFAAFCRDWASRSRRADRIARAPTARRSRRRLRQALAIAGVAFTRLAALDAHLARWMREPTNACTHHARTYADERLIGRGPGADDSAGATVRGVSEYPPVGKCPRGVNQSRCRI